MLYRKKISCFTLLLFTVTILFAQQEVLSPLNCNPQLWRETARYRQQNRYFIDRGNIVVTASPLSLPFRDEFSVNRQRSYEVLQSSIFDSVTQAIGGCINAEGFATTLRYMSAVPTWSFSYDTLNDQVDSVLQTGENFTAYNNNFFGCFSIPPVTETYYPLQYTYLFDSLSGAKLDSTLVTADTVELAVAKIYKAQAAAGTFWMDNHAWINNSMPVFPPTLGVATLDGLNSFGLPYNNSSPTAYGNADILTSAPIDLSVISPDDTSVYLSFFYEPKGFGDFPNLQDSLIVEALNQYTGNWDQLWATPGFSTFAELPDNRFRQVLINLPVTVAPNTNYFFNQFQFRFRNKANLTGNVDHWHIDYVRLDRNRNASDTTINDIAVMYPLGSVLKKFSHMPADQFSPSDLADSLGLQVRNNNFQFNTPATNFTFTADELVSNTNLYTSPVLSFIAYEFFPLGTNPSSSLVFPNPLPGDSFVIRSRCNVQVLDPIATNNVAENTQVFSNILGYDDGSAERAYGIEGLGLKKFALRFDLNQPDTLAGFQIHFSHIDQNVNNLIFNFYIWDSLRLNDLGFADSPIFTLDNEKPLYVDSTNGFATYVLDSPLILSGPIYFGWAQTDDRNIQIGYDLNSPLGRPNMYRFFNGVWSPSNLSTNGSPMMRLILDGDYTGGGTVMIPEWAEAEPVVLYPNPAGNWLGIKCSGPVAGAYTVYTGTGAVCLQGEIQDERIDVSHLSPGLYYLSYQSTQEAVTYRTRFVKR